MPISPERDALKQDHFTIGNGSGSRPPVGWLYSLVVHFRLGHYHEFFTYCETRRMPHLYVPRLYTAAQIRSARLFLWGSWDVCVWSQNSWKAERALVLQMVLFVIGGFVPDIAGRFRCIKEGSVAFCGICCTAAGGESAARVTHEGGRAPRIDLCCSDIPIHSFCVRR